ncbi:MAG: hypothetical protein IJ633_00125 [Prevotella sp.]|nr:hypothetical protein [Prevotella sp.]
MGMQVMAQTEQPETPVDSIDIMMARIDSLTRADSILTIQEEPTLSVMVDSTRIVKPKRDWNTWQPDPKRALWLALVLPGAGQIYNRKYWKLPIIYGGFIGCIYALTWNNMMYKDYSQAYLDIMDTDPGTASYNKFLHLGVEINSSNESRYKEIFKNRKDKYRRWRDMSFFVMIGVYALSVIDAYVDAELSAFDISKDLSLKVEPAVIPNHGGGTPLQAQSLGVNCKLNF